MLYLYNKNKKLSIKNMAQEQGHDTVQNSGDRRIVAQEEVSNQQRHIAKRRCIVISNYH